MIGKKRPPEPLAAEDDRLTRELEDTFPASDPPSLTEPDEGVIGDPATDDRLHKICKRAYEIWVEEGGAHGRHEDHWRRAETEVSDVDARKVKRPRS